MLLVSPLFTRFDQKPTQSAAFRTGPGLPNPSCTVNLILVYMACFYCYQHQFYCNRSSNPALLLTPKGRQHMLQMWFSRYHQIHCCLKSLNCVSQKWNPGGWWYTSFARVLMLMLLKWQGWQKWVFTNLPPPPPSHKILHHKKWLNCAKFWKLGGIGGSCALKVIFHCNICHVKVEQRLKLQ